MGRFQWILLKRKTVTYQYTYDEMLTIFNCQENTSQSDIDISSHFGQKTIFPKTKITHTGEYGGI